MSIKKIFYFAIFLIFYQTNVFSIEADVFVQSTVNRASAILSKNIDKNEKIDELKLIAKETVDIRGVGFYSLGSARKNLNDEQKSKYSSLFEQYFLKSFSSRLAEYTNPEIEVTGKEKLNDKYTIVNSTLVATNERPEVNCSIADITCDSDGTIRKFINQEGITPTMAIHELKANENYYIGLFLTGAYQDVMGDMHNLFGRLNEVHVYGDNDDPEGFYIEEIIRGNTSSMVLSTMQYNPEYMAQKMKKDVTKVVTAGSMAPRQGVKWVDFYEECLTNYTYLRHD